MMLLPCCFMDCRAFSLSGCAAIVRPKVVPQYLYLLKGTNRQPTATNGSLICDGGPWRIRKRVQDPLLGIDKAANDGKTREHEAREHEAQHAEGDSAREPQERPAVACTTDKGASRLLHSNTFATLPTTGEWPPLRHASERVRWNRSLPFATGITAQAWRCVCPQILGVRCLRFDLCSIMTAAPRLRAYVPVGRVAALLEEDRRSSRTTGIRAF